MTPVGGTTGSTHEKTNDTVVVWPPVTGTSRVMALPLAPSSGTSLTEMVCMPAGRL